MSFFARRRPSPPHASHGFSMTWPSPWQVGHGRMTVRKPCETRWRPLPPHVGQVFGFDAGSGAAALALLAALEPGDRDGRLDAERRVAERDRHAVHEIAAGHRARRSAEAAARGEPEEASEEIRQVAEAGRLESREAARAAPPDPTPACPNRS